jgi:hypothetical protein
VIFKKFTILLTKSDIILIFTLILISVSLSIFFYQNKNTKQAQVFYQGKDIGTYKLDQNKSITIDKGIIVEIKDGKARLKQDTSPLQIGVKQNWSNTYPIISVPSQLIIKFINDKDEEMIITY